MRPQHLQRLYDDFAESRLREARELATSLSAYREGGWRGVRVLDVGCGNGAFARAFAEAGGDVTAFDLCPVDWARKMQGDASFHLLQADALHLPFSDQSFDVILMSDFLEHVPTPGEVLRGAARLLRPAGFLWIATTNRGSILTTIADPHYNLPFINCLPRGAAEWYVTRLTKVSPTYRVGTYFFGPQLARLISRAGLEPAEVTDVYERKIRAASFAAAPGRRLLARLLRKPAAQRLMLSFARTQLFRHLVQPGWVFLGFRPMPHSADSLSATSNGAARKKQQDSTRVHSRQFAACYNPGREGVPA